MEGLIEPELRHQLVPHGGGDGHVIGIERPAGNGVHHQEDDERHHDEGDGDRDEATEHIAQHEAPPVAEEGEGWLIARLQP